ncbi:SPOR domain-containing protein [Novosphingobium taihuense]|uniref:Rare lipoprotein A n=1 Tax=Novosphingobium taihuense TaxID=260085 RepID=A0A7W7ABA9_9SPHN|nr:SPOR domain-containing protein [Novosphingobium taihuense]MBB4613843.1 rare lipoprotein A [Novosphingobium taihuense]TWH83351.1 rare lipoprotein A [Novosphingobium taihuense]
MVLGAPFVIDGVTYTPVDVMNYDSVGYAQIGEGDGVSGAHRTLPLPSYVEVTSLETGRTILVRLTQRGPMTGSDLVSLSAGAWTQLGAKSGARVPVRVRRVNPPEAERTLLRSGGQAPARMDTPPGLLAALKRKLGLAVAPPVVMEVATPAPTKVEPKPVAKVEPKSATKVEPKTVATPVTAPKPAAPPKPAEPVKAPVTTSSKGLYVQVGAYSTRARADAAAKAVGGTVTASGKLWRVRVGPHKDRGQADAALAKVRAGGYADAMVVTAP